MDQYGNPWSQLHPDGQVKDLIAALDANYDDKYAAYSKVGFQECFPDSIYDFAAESPLWPGATSQDGHNWDTWAKLPRKEGDGRWESNEH